MATGRADADAVRNHIVSSTGFAPLSQKTSLRATAFCIGLQSVAESGDAPSCSKRSFYLNWQTAPERYGAALWRAQPRAQAARAATRAQRIIRDHFIGADFNRDQTLRSMPGCFKPLLGAQPW